MYRHLEAELYLLVRGSGRPRGCQPNTPREKENKKRVDCGEETGGDKRKPINGLFPVEKLGEKKDKKKKKQKKQELTLYPFPFPSSRTSKYLQGRKKPYVN